MAAFDGKQQRVCVRVVYDGIASAGKTTNLRQLGELFATQRTCELLTPLELDGRTLYFDWIQIAAGMVCGFPLVCQVITVPGQMVLTPRRRHLLSTADVVVYVCDSAESSVPRALEGLAPFDQVERERGEPIPLVVQANKQDQSRALSGAALVAGLGRPRTPVVEAIASDGIGVIDTFVTAVRAVVRSIQARVEDGRIRVAVRPAETADAALAQLTQVQVDPEWAIEMLLEEASNSFVLGEVDELGEPFDADAAPDDARVGPPTWRPEGPATNAPPLPSEHVPTGFVWPAHTGRAALRALAADARMSKPVVLDGEGYVEVVVGDAVLATSRQRRFETSELARQALVRSARECTQLGPLLAPETVLVAQPAADGSSWLWAIAPRMPTVAHLLASRDSPLARPALLAAFGAAIGEALRIEAAHGAALDLSLRSFGVERGVVRYVGEVFAADRAGHDTAAAVDDLLVAVGAVEGDLETMVAALESAIAARLSGEERAKVAERARWRGAEALPEAVREARRRIEGALRSRRAAA